MWNFGLVQRMFQGKEIHVEVMTEKEVSTWTTVLVVRMKNTRCVYETFLDKT